jgi:hypothetical protein
MEYVFGFLGVVFVVAMYRLLSDVFTEDRW